MPKSKRIEQSSIAASWSVWWGKFDTDSIRIIVSERGDLISFAKMIVSERGDLISFAKRLDDCRSAGDTEKGRVACSE
jgi:hypothetical protein